MATTSTIPQATYEQLLDLRVGLRRFLHWSERQAQTEGITIAQHQLMLAIRGSRDPKGPAIGDVAEALLLKHHSVVGLIDRAQEAGLVTRHRDPERPSVVRLALTPRGAELLERLSREHLEELARTAPQMQSLWRDAATISEPSGGPR